VAGARPGRRVLSAHRLSVTAPAGEDKKRRKPGGRSLAGKEFQQDRKQPARQCRALLRLQKDVARSLAEQSGIGGFDLGRQPIPALGKPQLIASGEKRSGCKASPPHRPDHACSSSPL
jgi:hypothetical protein